MFYPKEENDPKDPSLQGDREDGRNLVDEWLQKSKQHVYVWNNTDFKNLNVSSDNKVLGMFVEFVE